MNKRHITTLLLTLNLLLVNNINVQRQHELNMKKNQIIEQNLEKQHKFVQSLVDKAIKDMEDEERKIAEAKAKEIEKQKQIQKQKEEEAKWIPVRISYYTNDVSDCGKTDAIGASGKKLSRGGNFVASPRDIPFGTKIYIEGKGTYEVADRGGAIVWSNGVMHLDVFIPNASQSYLNKLGVKYTRAKIID